MDDKKGLSMTPQPLTFEQGRYFGASVWNRQYFLMIK